MCQAIREMMEDSRAEGEIKGEIKTYIHLVGDGLYTLEQAADKMGMTLEEFKRKAEEFGLMWEGNDINLAFVTWNSNEYWISNDVIIALLRNVKNTIECGWGWYFSGDTCSGYKASKIHPPISNAFKLGVLLYGWGSGD